MSLFFLQFQIQLSILSSRQKRVVQSRNMINSNLSPPSYLSLQELNNSHLNDHQHIYLNLPSGYFLIQSKSSKNNNLVLDIKSGKNLDGTEVSTLYFFTKLNA